MKKIKQKIVKTINGTELYNVKYSRRRNKTYDKESNYRGFCRCSRISHIYSKHKKDSVKYDDRGNLIYRGYPDGFEEWWTYDENNNLIRQRNSDEDDRRYKYDEKQRLIEVNDSRRASYKLEYNQDDDVIRVTTDEIITEYIYHEREPKIKKLKSKKFLGISGKLKYTYDYDKNGNMIHYIRTVSKNQSLWPGIVDDLCYEIWHDYDKNGNVIYTKKAFRCNKTNNLYDVSEEEFIYDDKGNMIYPYKKQISPEQFKRNKARQEYDIWLQYGIRKSFSKTHEARVISISYNENNDRITYIENMVNDKENRYWYSYDSHGNMTSIIKSFDSDFPFNYSSKNKEISEKVGDKIKFDNIYDEDGYITKSILTTGEVIVYEYYD